MKFTFETSEKKKKGSLSSYNGVLGFKITRDKYSDAVLLGIFKKIFKRLNLIDYSVNSINPITNGTSLYFLNNQMNIAFAELFANGFILFQKTATGKIKYIRKAEATQVGNTWYYEKQELDVFYSDTYDVYGKSDMIVLRDILKAIDNSLNANQTIIKRLGSVIVATPEQPSNNPQAVMIDDDTKDKLEKDTQEDYGMLDEQKQILFLRRALKLENIKLGSKDLMITETLETFVKILCDATNIPYDVMAMSGQSTFANQEQAEKSMQDTAEEFVSKVWTYFNQMGVQFNWKVNNNKYGKTI
jgi:hypothetical protein